MITLREIKMVNATRMQSYRMQRLPQCWVILPMAGGL